MLRRIVGPAMVALLPLVACSPESVQEAPVPEASTDSRPRMEASENPFSDLIPRIQHIVPEGVARLPVFTPAVRVGDLVFLSGMIGTPPSGELTIVEGGAAAETHAIMANMTKVLAAAGLDFTDLVKCTVFLSDIAYYGEVNEAYVTYFAGMEPPARSAMAGSGLALGALVEIECIAAAR